MTSPADRCRPLTFRLDDATAADLNPELAAGYESSYRRGVHQALAFAGDLADQARTLTEARRTLARAENIAGELRSRRKGEGRGMLLDHVRTALGRRRGGPKR